MHTKEAIILQTIPILARDGYAGTSMRKVSAAISREPSIIYVHFADKHALLREVRLHINRYLDRELQYPDSMDVATLLRHTLRFQFEQREMIVALLQYFMAQSEEFGGAQLDGGYLPESAYAHMTRIIQKGVAEGVYQVDDMGFTAKAAAHLVNGFLMEYFDRPLKSLEQKRIVEKLAACLEQAFTGVRAVS